MSFIIFFFSSRRRHTRWPRDWSSDVCSSDLVLVTEGDAGLGIGATFVHVQVGPADGRGGDPDDHVRGILDGGDRKSTRLNSSHVAISYAVFCLKKKRAPVMARAGITTKMQTP